MAEREWREASDMRPSRFALPLVVGVAALLRFWHLDHGVPFAVGVDEPEIIIRVVQMMKTGDLNPHFFDYPALYFYVQLVVACLRFLVGATQGAFRALDHATPGDFYLWGRVVTATLGTLTVVLVYQIGMRWGARHALLAAGLMAVMPMHVRESHYVLTDVPLTFFTTLTFLLALGAHERNTVRAFAWAGVAAGLAAATKYNGALALLLPLVAAWATPQPVSERARRGLAALGAAIAAFLVAAPYTVLDLPAFLNAYAVLAAQYNIRRSGEAPWLTYLKHLQLTMGWPGAALLGAGVVLGVTRVVTGPGHARFAMLISFPLVYFYVVSTRSLVFGRYLLPVLPFCTLLAAIAVVSGVSLLRRFSIPRPIRRALIAGGTIAALLPPALSAIGFNRSLGRPSTQQEAFNWITSKVPNGTRVAVEANALHLSDRRFALERVVRLSERTADDYKSAGVQYIVATSAAYDPIMQAPQAKPVEYARYRRLFEEWEQVALFDGRDGASGPEIRILRARE